MTLTAMCVLLTGPAAAGKTTVAGEWARRRRQPTIHISLDDVREMMKGGFADPQLGWTSETRRQFEWARGACAKLARHYVEEGVDCIIDDVVFPDWPDADYEGWRTELIGVRHVLVVLAAADRELYARNAAREGRRHLDNETIELIASRMRPWLSRDVPKLDSSELTIDDVVEELDSIVEAYRLRPEPESLA